MIENITSITNLIIAITGIIVLFFNIKAINNNTKSKEIEILDNTVKKLLENELILNQEYKNKGNKEKRDWDSIQFNTLELFCFYVNNKFIKRYKIKTFLNKPIKLWYEEVFLKHFDKEEINDPNFYEEFKKRYNSIKESEILTKKWNETIIFIEKIVLYLIFILILIFLIIKFYL